MNDWDSLFGGASLDEMSETTLFDYNQRLLPQQRFVPTIQFKCLVCGTTPQILDKRYSYPPGESWITTYYLCCHGRVTRCTLSALSNVLHTYPVFEEDAIEFGLHTDASDGQKEI